ncbi:hypothetical protein BGC31_14475 [Komagataeibacter xylinus]|nr:hypothetical protein H845_182 [Komagataeibacter xylinus E25]RFP06236.1 hypothetical protein BFX83_16145 [Komagataeibacter xylinus]RFP06254.1 hypothetical protein BGC31_14475 [Komagataeibacter xylinus]
MIAEYDGDTPCKNPVAQYMTRPICGFPVRNPDASNHIEPFRLRQLKHLGSSLSLVGRITICKDIKISVYISKHAAHRISLALQGNMMNAGTCLTCHFNSTAYLFFIIGIDNGIQKNFHKRIYYF